MQRRRERVLPAHGIESVFGRVLREARTERGLTQEALAHESGYHPTYVSQLERGKKGPTLRSLCDLAAVLAIKPAELVLRFETALEKYAARQPASKDR